MTHLLPTTSLEKEPFWATPVERVVHILGANAEKGLDEAEAQDRLKEYGRNAIPQAHQVTWLSILFNQCKSPLLFILVVAAVLTGALGHYHDALFIALAVVVNLLLGFYQEFKAEKALAELKTYLKERAQVIREGREYEIDAVHLVPGDTIRLSQGDRVPVDARLIFANDLQVDEAILTGEALSVDKTIEVVAANADLSDQHNMVFTGTLVTQGVATAVVCRTGALTELGRIALLVADSSREETPLQKKIRVFSLRVGLFLSALTVLIFATGIWLGHSVLDMFLISVAVAVGAVPEGLPVALTVILAIGVQRMARRKGVVRKLLAAEALGSTTIILTDKTGTLTQAKMTLGQVIPLMGGSETALLQTALFNTSVVVENREDNPLLWRMDGRTIEMALVQSAAVRGVTLSEEEREKKIIATLPFNPINKFSTSLVRLGGREQLIYLGAPDVLLAHSQLSASQKEGLLIRIDSLAYSGELVLGLARAEVGKEEPLLFAKEHTPKNLELLALLTLRDPIRENTREAMSRVTTTGVRTLILTGDHKGTAEAVAREVGMVIQTGSVLDATELRQLSDAELAIRLQEAQVIARVSPFDKLRVVKAFQAMGEVVAMTGDGVNDAPSIKQADVGVAMGSGTEVAHNVADLVLLDDNFETIVAAIEEGRQIMHNIQKVLVYLLSSVADELILIGGALLTGLALPITALQILWVNFFSDSLPAVAFAFEKNDREVGYRAREASSGLFTPIMKVLVLFIGISTSALLFVLYFVLMHSGFPPDIVRTFIYASFASYSLLLAFSLKSLKESILSLSPFSNLYLVFGVALGIVLIGASIYVPTLQSLFDTVALPFPWLIGVLAVGVVNIALVEVGKWFFRRGTLH